MRRGIVTLAVVVVIAIAAWLLFANGNSSNDNQTNNSDTAANQTPAASNNSGTNSIQSESAGKITIANMAFSPSQITVNKGDTVTWTNNDSMAHTVTSDTGSELDSGDIQPGSTYSHTFNTAGSFQYHCSIHPSMRGTIVVK